MFNFNFKQFFSASYIFEKTPLYQTSFLYIVAVFILFIAGAFGAWFFYEKKKRKLSFYGPLQKKMFSLFFYSGVFGLILSFFHWQEIAYLGSRFFFLILALTFVVWGASVLNYYLRVLPKTIKKYHEKKNFEKYLPANAR